MHLSFRSARPHQFAQCIEGMGENFVYPPDLRKQVPLLWGQWLRDGVMTAHVIEHHRQARTEIAGLGAVVFVRERFIEEFRRQRRPYLRQELVRRALAGESVVLTPEDMRNAHRGEGLTLLFLSDPLGHRWLTDEQCLLVDAKWSEALYELRGCNIKAIWHEAYGAKTLRLTLGCGLLQRDDWADYWATRGTTPPADERPYLLGLTKEEALANPGTHASFLFLHVSAQFDFTARQQELLQQALRGATDDELAGELKVSASAVKKRWISVYQRVSDAMPGWLESAAANNDARGAEKRRYLLNYLRQHPEELHPAGATRD